MAFPSTISGFNYPATTDKLNLPSHSALHNAVSSVLGQVQTVIGLDGSSSVLGTIIGDLRSPGSNGGGHVQTANKGGTGQTSYTKGDLLAASSSSVLSKVAIGADNTVLTADGTQTSGVRWATQTTPTNAITVIAGFAGNPIAAVGTRPLVDNTQALIGLVDIKFPIVVNRVSMEIPSTSTAGVFRLGVYSESGTSMFAIAGSVTSSGVYSFPVSSVTLGAGNYWSALVPIAPFENTFRTWNTTTAPGNVLGTSVLGKYELSGTQSVLANSLPSAIVPSLLASYQSAPLIMRLDN